MQAIGRHRPRSDSAVVGIFYSTRDPFTDDQANLLILNIFLLLARTLLMHDGVGWFT